MRVHKYRYVQRYIYIHTYIHYLYVYTYVPTYEYLSSYETCSHLDHYRSSLFHQSLCHVPSSDNIVRAFIGPCMGCVQVASQLPVQGAAHALTSLRMKHALRKIAAVAVAGPGALDPGTVKHDSVLAPEMNSTAAATSAGV